MPNYDEQLDRKFEKQCEENEKFCRWMEEYPEKALIAEYRESVNPDFEYMNSVQYSKFLDWCNGIYDGGNL